MRRWSWLLLIVAWLLGASSVSFAQDPFSPRPKSSSEQTNRPPATQLQPTLWDRGVAYIKIQQQRFYRKLAGAIKSLKQEGSLQAAWTLIFLSLIYGILHAAGPGHGKAVISTYLLANREQIKRGLILSGAAALVQAFTAIALVSVFVILMKATGLEAQQTVRQAEYLSYGLIVIIGAWLMFDALRPARHAGHDHDHGGHGGRGHHHVVAPAPDETRKGWWSDLSVIGAVGIRPCSGAVLVLLFSYTLGIYLAGVASAFAMALGTAVTVGVLATMTLASKRVLLMFMDRNGTVARRLFRGLRILGGFAIVMIGLLLLDAARSATTPFL